MRLALSWRHFQGGGDLVGLQSPQPKLARTRLIFQLNELESSGIRPVHPGPALAHHLSIDPTAFFEYLPNDAAIFIGVNLLHADLLLKHHRGQHAP